MKLGILSFGVLLLAVAAFASAFDEWYWIGCSQTYNMHDSGGMDLIPCAISQSTGGGGSKIITHGNYYCLHFAEWRIAGNFRLHAVLYKGVNCDNWVPSDFCYNNPECNKYVNWGDTTVSLGAGNPYGYITLNYGTTQWGPLVFSHGGSPLVDKMGFKIRVIASGGKRDGGRGAIVKQVTSSRIASAPLTASAVKAAARKPRVR